jgi:hypothetical protein
MQKKFISFPAIWVINKRVSSGFLVQPTLALNNLRSLSRAAVWLVTFPKTRFACADNSLGAVGHL